MRNQPSNQSRDSRISHQSNYFREGRYVSREESPGLRQKTEIKQESYYEYVPSSRCNRRQTLGKDVTGYEKPSLPYYVVPVLYVPQKVLSSEEIRPSSPLQSKNTVSFLVKNKESSERGSINVDDIPCIPCETKKKNQHRTDSEREQILVKDLDLDQSCTGYINASYTQSSTSIMEDPSYNSETVPVTRYASPVYVQCQSKVYKQTQTRKKYNPRVYEKCLEQRQANNLQDKVETNQMPNSNFHKYWNPECNCYETIKKPRPSADEVLNFDYDPSQYIIRRKKEGSVLTNRPVSCDSYRPNNDREVHDRYYDVPSTGKPEYYDEYDCEDVPDNAKNSYQDYSDYISSEDYNNLQSSTLSCSKPSRTVKQLSSLIGRAYDCDIPADCRSPHADKLTSNSIENALGEAEVLIVEPQRRKPKESQTSFDIYSTYVATDQHIRDSKSTQTVDPVTTSVSTGTQTISAIRTFETCPPPYIDQVCEGPRVMIKQRTRENSPSPTRNRRNASPVKPSSFPPGDAKKLTIMKTAEMLEKPSSNQCTVPYPIKMQRCKRRKSRPA